MSEEAGLPEDVVAALHADHKAEAIRLLRAHQNIGLKEAQERVEAHCEMHMPDNAHPVPSENIGIGRLVVVGLGAAVLFTLYKYFA